MKTSSFNRFTFALFAILLFNSCAINAGDGIKPSKTYITRNYKVTQFSNIDINTVGDVYYTQSKDGKTSVEVYGPDNIVDLIELSIKDNTLRMSMKKKNRVRNVKKMKITIATPDLYNLSFTGVGNVYINDGITSTNLKINQEGVGDIKINSLVCDELTVNSSGVGNTKINGTAKVAFLTAEGVGNIEATDLEAKKVTASSQGVGNISCYATESISASAEGVGNIRYKGSPAEKRINKSGIGSVKQI